MELSRALNRHLPPEYAAEPQVHLGGGIEVDMGTLHEPGGGGPPAHSANGAEPAAWAAVEPTVCVETERPDVDEYAVRVIDLTGGQRLVAAVEFVSPSNKDRPDTRQAFVTKCSALLQEGVCVTIVDLVTSHHFNLYADLLAALDHTDNTLSVPSGSIYAVTCRGRTRRGKWVFEAWHRPLAVGQPLPDLPLWLPGPRPVTLELEATYEETCRGLRIR